jgi:hypothetical protein
MSSGMITAVAGVVGAIAALVVSLFSMRKTAAETAKLTAEAEKTRLETAEIGSRAANAESMARLAYQTSPARQSIALYDSRSGGFSLFDFETELWEPAAGELSLVSTQEASDDILVIVRHNTDGTFVAWLNRYGYIDGPTVIPVGDAAGVKRRFRVRCQVRAYGAEHTLLLTLKMTGAPIGDYLGQRRHRITPGVWTDIDDHFDLSFSANCRLRLEDRSVSAAPSRLEIRNFIVTEHEPPLKLMPVTT